MKILNETERTRLIAYLSANASDQTILDAVAEVVDQISRSKSEFKRLSVQLGAPKTEVIRREAPVAPTETPAAPTEITVTTPVTTLEPPGKTAGRIGKATLIAITSVLNKGPESIRNINAAINGKSDNTSALLKLLWSRGTLTWDGERYKLK